jgi:hypothetical protein
MSPIKVEQTEEVMTEWRKGNGLILPVRVLVTNKQASGEVMVERWTGAQRLWRTAKVLLSMTVVTVASAFVPILHFVLVPLFLVITLVSTSVTYAKRKRIRGGIATCPLCGKRFTLMFGAARLPFQDHCTECNRTVTIAAG